jgi:hypothetical protein
VIHRIAMPLICIVGIQAGYAIAQPTESFLESSEEEMPQPSVTQVIPANVTGLLLFNNQPQPWQSMSQFLPIPPGFAAPGFLSHMPPQVNFATEIKPWLGDWSANVLMPKADGSQTRDLDDRALTLAPVTDSSLLPQFIEQLKQQWPNPPIEREYQGVKILVWPEQVIPENETEPPLPLDPSEPRSQKDGTWLESKWPMTLSKTLSQTILGQTSTAELMPEAMPEAMPSLAIALVPGYVAAATTAAPIEQWLDSRNQGMTLAENPNFQKTLENPNFGRSLLVGYGQISQLAESLFSQEIDPRALPIPLPIPDSQQLQNTAELLGESYSTGEVLVWFQGEGLRTQSRMYHKTPLSSNEIDPMGNEIYNQIPAATYLALSGKNLNQIFLGIFQGLLNQPVFDEILQILSNTNLGNTNTGRPESQSTLIPWMDDEYALFLFPTNGGLFPAFDRRLQLGLGMIIKTSDPTAAQQALQNLNQWAVRSSNENVTVKNERLNGRSVTQWQAFNPQRQDMESLLSYTWLNPETLVIASGLDPLKDLHPQPYLSLNQSFTFTTATRSLPAQNNGYFYMNFGSVLSLINNFIDPEEFNNNPMLMLGRSILGNIRSITLSTATTTIDTQADFFLVLSPRSQNYFNMQR